MELLVVRHAIAVDADEFASTGQSDDLRPLTPEGATRMRAVARGLRSIVPGVERIATSPLTRAMQTAAILADEYDLEPVSTDSLRPEARYESLLRWWSSKPGTSVMAIVGHEPHLSGLVSWLLAGSDSPFIELKKGAACLLEFESTPSVAKGTLLWSLAPAHLRRLGD
ncbi:MAG: histidine phosphatase family protein [Gemmatimonadaceae bacterium]